MILNYSLIKPGPNHPFPISYIDFPAWLTSSALKMEAAGSYMLVPIYQTTGSHIPEDHSLSLLTKYFNTKFFSFSHQHHLQGLGLFVHSNSRVSVPTIAFYMYIYMIIYFSVMRKHKQHLILTNIKDIRAG
jgi:hypothetical protein